MILDHVRAGRNLLFSSHQLDLVEDLCETITLIDHGRVVLHGDLRALKAASPDRYLRVDVAVEPAWIDALRAAARRRRDASGTRLRLAPGADPGAVLDAVRAHARGAATSPSRRRACPSCSSPPPASAARRRTERAAEPAG